MASGDRALRVYLGRKAAALIGERGWSPDLFNLLLGASGGAKWLILSQLDRILFGDFLQGGTGSLSTLGSSIGAWRHTCLAMPDPVAAIERMEEAYLDQRYSAKPDTREVSKVSLGILEHTLGRHGEEHLLQHPRIQTHIVTARGRGAAGSSSNTLLATAMGSAALSNAVSRRLLTLHFQRVMFHTGSAPAAHMRLQDFDTQCARLEEKNLRRAIHASGSIPFVLHGERDIPGGPAGQYWDGGIIDYHFNPEQLDTEGLVLYPHFSEQLFPGWFDKFLPWRQAANHRYEQLVLLCPSAAFIDALPHGKIPDRSDFKNFRFAERLAYWKECIVRSEQLAQEFAELIAGNDPLAGAVIFK